MPRCLYAAPALILIVLVVGCPRQAPETTEPVAPPVAQNPAPPQTAGPAQPAAPAAEAGAEASGSAAPAQEGAAAPEPAPPAPATAETAPDAGPASKTPARQAEGPAAPSKPAAAKPAAGKPRPAAKKWPIPEGPLNDDKYVAISAKYAAAVMATPEKDRTEDSLKTLLREVLKEAKVSFDEYQEYTLKVAADAERSEQVGKWIVQALADGGLVNLSGSAGVPGQDLKLRGVVEDDKKGKK